MWRIDVVQAVDAGRRIAACAAHLTHGSFDWPTGGAAATAEH
jgi:hypothetical protein